MLPAQILDQLNSARQAKIDAVTAEGAVVVAQSTLSAAQAKASETDSAAATARTDAISAVTNWLDSMVDVPTDVPESNGTTPSTEGNLELPSV